MYLDEIIQQNLIVGVNNFAGGTILYPLQDLLYRTAALADTTRILREAYDTDAYGNTLIFRNGGTPPAPINFSSDAQVSVPTCPFIFTGQRFDAETGLYYYKRRFYSPALGRFLSRDSLLPADLNPYQSAGGSPLIFVDPNGEHALTPQDIDRLLKSVRQRPDRLGCWTLRLSVFYRFLPADVDTPQKMQEAFSWGCIGFCSWAQNHDNPGVVQSTWDGSSLNPPWGGMPENCGHARNEVYGSRTRCYLTKAKALEVKCADGSKPFVFAKQGCWKNGKPPQPFRTSGTENDQIPNDSVVGCGNGGGDENYATVFGQYSSDSRSDRAWSNGH